MSKKQFFLFLFLFVIFEFFLFYLKKNFPSDTVVVNNSSSTDPPREEVVINNNNSVNNNVVPPSLNIVNIECDSLSFLDNNSIFINSRFYSLNSVFGKYGTINRIFDGIVFIQGWDLNTVYILTEKIYLNDLERKNEGRKPYMSIKDELSKMDGLISNESSKNLNSVL